MADNNSSSNKPKPKRKLKPAQSVREKAQQSKDTGPKTKKRTRVTKVLGSPFIKIGKALGKYKLFRIIAKILQFIGKIIVPKYIRSSWQELKLVTWPNRKESRRLTYAVLAFAIVFGALVATLDYGLNDLFKVILLGK